MLWLKSKHYAQYSVSSHYISNINIGTNANIVLECNPYILEYYIQLK